MGDDELRRCLFQTSHISLHQLYTIYLLVLVFVGSVLGASTRLNYGPIAPVAVSPSFVSPPSRNGATNIELPPRNKKSIALPTAHDSNDESLENGSGKSRSARDRGIYSRPSAAIEKGSGFFVPGFEGSRIRLIFGITVMLADAVNHVLAGGRPGDWAQTVAESVSVFYGVLLLLQGSIEIAVENGYSRRDSNRAIAVSDETQDRVILDEKQWNNMSNSVPARRDEELIARIAQAIMKFTPATQFYFVEENVGVLFSFGVGSNEGVSMSSGEEKRLVNISLDAVAQSRGGRIALPSDHPASKLLPKAARRCILVQKANGYKGSRASIMIGSDSLLQSFTKNDLRWIGQLAEIKRNS